MRQHEPIEPEPLTPQDRALERLTFNFLAFLGIVTLAAMISRVI